MAQNKKQKIINIPLENNLFFRFEKEMLSKADEIAAAKDEDVIEISKRLFAKNKEAYEALAMLMMDLKRVEERAEVEGWIDAEDLERELEL